MPWYISEVEHLRVEFVMIAREAGVSISEACRQFGISRKTGYKWLNRYEDHGLRGLSDRSRRPQSSPSVDGETVIAIINLRQEHPYWGPKKLRALLLRQGFGDSAPGVATIGRILTRTGLSTPKGRGRPRRWHSGPIEAQVLEPNDVWTVDFKGWWRTGDGSRCEPLSVVDLFSRYILCLRPMRRHGVKDVRPVFEQIFERYGLPRSIRSDNGSPFASITAPHGLTRLSAWWRSLGILPERIEPGHPEQNGSHERMHGNIARELEGRPAATVMEESRRLENWRLEYNLHRPHEALEMRVPGDLYRRSPRRLGDASPFCYPLGHLRRRVRKDGYVCLKGRHVYISAALSGSDVGIEQVGENEYQIWFCDLKLGEIDLEQGPSLRPTASTSDPAPSKV